MSKLSGYSRLEIPTDSDDYLVENLIPIGKPARHRNWERINRAYSYAVPPALVELATRLREEILSIAQYDEYGQLRRDQTTADQIATILVDWALKSIERTPGQIKPAPNPKGRGHMSVYTTAWDAWEKPGPVSELPRARRKKKKHGGNEKQKFLAYRWADDIDQALRQVAKENNISTGETVIRLLEIAVDAYKQREFRITVEIQALVRASGWEAQE